MLKPSVDKRTRQFLHSAPKAILFIRKRSAVRLPLGGLALPIIESERNCCATATVSTAASFDAGAMLQVENHGDA